MRGSGRRAWTARMGRAVRVVPVAAVGALLLGLAACSDDGPSGPGTWDGLVRSSTEPAGAVVLELDGTGIQRVEGFGPTRVFAHRTDGGESDGGPEGWRVVLVTSEPGSMAFRVSVDDLAAGRPSAVVVSAVDGQDQPLTALASFSVEMSR